jgi:hypothetical protein
MGIGNKRRQAVNQLKKDADALGFILSFEVKKGKGYRLIFESYLRNE